MIKSLLVLMLETRTLTSLAAELKTSVPAAEQMLRRLEAGGYVKRIMPEEAENSRNCSNSSCASCALKAACRIAPQIRWELTEKGRAAAKK